MKVTAQSTFLAIIVVVLCTSCTQSPSQPLGRLSWSLPQDVAALSETVEDNPEYAYRISELAHAANSPEYVAFLARAEALESINRAIVYYEVANNSSEYFFVVLYQREAVCEVLISDRHGVRERRCD